MKLYRAQATMSVYFLAEDSATEEGVEDLASSIVQAEIDDNNGAPDMSIKTAPQAGISSFGKPWHNIRPYTDEHGNKSDKTVRELFESGELT